MFHIHALKNICTVLPPGRRVLSKTVSLPKKAPLLKVTSQTHTSTILASTIVIVLPPFSFGFSKQITHNCFIQNSVVNTSKRKCLLEGFILH